MKIKKNTLILTLVLILSFVLTGCGGNDAPTDTSEGNGGILIAYFSYTGNTQKVAQMIAEYTGGDLAEIKRAEEYEDLQEEAEVEIQDGIHPEITVSISIHVSQPCHAQGAAFPSMYSHPLGCTFFPSPFIQSSLDL